MKFYELGLSPELLSAVSDMGVREPTAIQQQAIAPVLQGRDVWATAPTGSGKTLAFVLPLVHRLTAQNHAPQRHRRTRVLVLLPTRELAVQVGDVCSRVAVPQGLRVSVIHGGVSINPQLMGLRGGADVVVATPGRLLDVIAHNALGLSDLEHLVLDEADRMLDAGFANELQGIMALVPAQRQTLLFSATYGKAVQALAKGLLTEPVQIGVEDHAQDAPEIQQRAIAVDEKNRTQLLRQWVEQHAGQRILVFVATRYATIHVADKLYRAGINATPLHGEMPQATRQSVLQDFKQALWQVVVTTDLSARGIDIEQLDMVVNYDLPRSATDYTHRIGRTGRAGQKGQAVSLVTPAQANHWRVIQKRNALDLPPEVVAGFEPTEAPPPSAVDPLSNGGIKGKRPSKKDKLRAQAAGQALRK